MDEKQLLAAMEKKWISTDCILTRMQKDSFYQQKRISLYRIITPMIIQRLFWKYHPKFNQSPSTNHLFRPKPLNDHDNSRAATIARRREKIRTAWPYQIHFRNIDAILRCIHSLSLPPLSTIPDSVSTKVPIGTLTETTTTTTTVPTTGDYMGMKVLTDEQVENDYGQTPQFKVWTSDPLKHTLIAIVQVISLEPMISTPLLHTHAICVFEAMVPTHE